MCVYNMSDMRARENCTRGERRVVGVDILYRRRVDVNSCARGVFAVNAQLWKYNESFNDYVYV